MGCRESGHSASYIPVDAKACTGGPERLKRYKTPICGTGVAVADRLLLTLGGDWRALTALHPLHSFLGFICRKPPFSPSSPWEQGGALGSVAAWLSPPPTPGAV